VVLADLASEDLFALDLGGDIDDIARLTLWSFLLEGLVRAVAVVVPGVLGQDFAEVPFAGDRRIVPSPTRCPSPRSSPWMRRYPQRGFCRASCSTSARTSPGTGGRPDAFG
jgi:hypothetical protein